MNIDFIEMSLSIELKKASVYLVNSWERSHKSIWFLNKRQWQNIASNLLRKKFLSKFRISLMIVVQDCSSFTIQITNVIVLFKLQNSNTFSDQSHFHLIVLHWIVLFYLTPNYHQKKTCLILKSVQCFSNVPL
jgi:hypothetical protein